MESRVKEAVALAIQGRWQEVVTANRAILEAYPEDVETYNRLGRALIETGDYPAARESYGHALELDPYNKIAKKNLKRLSELGEPAPKNDQRRVVADVFVEETSKARTVGLVNLAPRDIVARMAPGEEVGLRVEGQRLMARKEPDEYLGEVDPTYAMRLVKLIGGGNQYIAAVSSVADDEVKVLIREIYQDPSQAGRPSFPPKKKGGFRPYVRESLIRQRLEDEEEEVEVDQETDDTGGVHTEGFVEVDY